MNIKARLPTPECFLRDGDYPVIDDALKRSRATTFKKQFLPRKVLLMPCASIVGYFLKRRASRSFRFYGGLDCCSQSHVKRQLFIQINGLQKPSLVGLRILIFSLALTAFGGSQINRGCMSPSVRPADRRTRYIAVARSQRPLRLW